MMIGNTMNAMVSQPASNETPKFSAMTNMPKPNRPKTIEGTPARLMIDRRRKRMNGPSVAYSLR